MLRLILTYLSRARWAQNLVRKWGFAQRMASRFVAGDNLDDAVNAIKELNDQGIYATLDHLGENVTTREGARAATEEIINILDRIALEGIQSGVSIKLSQIGLVLDQKFCQDNLEAILARARELNIFIRIDMEDSSLTEKTLGCFFASREAGYPDTVGIVLQSYLYRTEKDLQMILEDGGTVRLCKGAYNEPVGVAFPKKSAVDRNFDQLTKQLLDFSLQQGMELSPDGMYPPTPALATHDEARIEYAIDYAREIDLPKKKIEFQMLYGIRSELQLSLNEQGFPVRVYVPYGSEWYPYFMRRLAERPANLWFFLSNYFRG